MDLIKVNTEPGILSQLEKHDYMYFEDPEDVIVQLAFSNLFFVQENTGAELTLVAMADGVTTKRTHESFLNGYWLAFKLPDTVKVAMSP